MPVPQRCQQTDHQRRLPQEQGAEEAPKAKKVEVPRQVRDETWAPWNAVKQEWLNVGGDAGYHFYGSGRIFYQMADAFGKEMVGLLENKRREEPWETRV